MTSRARKPRGRPPLPPEERRVRVYLRLARETVEALDQYAERWGIGRTEAVEEAVMVLTRSPKVRPHP